MILQVIGPNGEPIGAKSHALHLPQLLDVSPSELHALDNYRDHIEAWGWRYNSPVDTATGNRAEQDGKSTAVQLTHAAGALQTVHVHG